jgi:hypothetical protein
MAARGTQPCSCELRSKRTGLRRASWCWVTSQTRSPKCCHLQMRFASILVLSDSLLVIDTPLICMLVVVVHGISGLVSASARIWQTFNARRHFPEKAQRTETGAGSALAPLRKKLLALTFFSCTSSCVFGDSGHATP